MVFVLCDEKWHNVTMSNKKRDIVGHTKNQAHHLSYKELYYINRVFFINLALSHGGCKGSPRSLERRLFGVLSALSG